MSVNIESLPLLPSYLAKEHSPVAWNYAIMQRAAGHITGYVKFKINIDAALNLAAASPYPDGVKIGVMKQIANNREVTLEQMRILLGWAARRAQHTGR